MSTTETCAADLKVQQDADYSPPLADIYTYADSSGNAISNSGWTAILKVATSNSQSATVLLTLTNGSGITLLGSSGQFYFTITAAQLKTIPSGVYWYDCFLVEGGGTRHKLLEGNFIVEASTN